MREGDENRRGFLQLAGAAGVAAVSGVVSACSSSKPAPGTPAAGSVTITHLFGETVIKEPPKRVVSAGYTEQDDLLAVGVVPIALTNWWGDQPFAVWPWAQSKLGGAQPVVLNLDNGIPVDQIAGLKPDLIVAINAGVDADTYQKLSSIAPTVPQADGDAFFEPWKEQATAIGQAVFQADQMKSLIDAVDKQFAAVAQKNPQLAGQEGIADAGRTLARHCCRNPGGLADRLPEPDGSGHRGQHQTLRKRPSRRHPARSDQSGARFRRRGDLDDRKSG